MTYLNGFEDSAAARHSGSRRQKQAGRSLVTRVIPVLAGLALACGTLGAQTIVPALDQPGRKGDMARLVQQKAKEKFDTADRDKDDKLSREEALAAFPYMGEHFEKYDRDGDGFLNWEEYVGHDRWKKD